MVANARRFSLLGHWEAKKCDGSPPSKVFAGEL